MLGWRGGVEEVWVEVIVLVYGIEEVESHLFLIRMKVKDQVCVYKHLSISTWAHIIFLKQIYIHLKHLHPPAHHGIWTGVPPPRCHRLRELHSR